MNNFQIGDLVAHKHYPKKAIGKISKFYDSGRVGIDDGCRPRSFLPSNLILCGEKITPEEPEELEDAIAPEEPEELEDAIAPEEPEELEDAIASSEVMEVTPAQKACPECGSYDVSKDDFLMYWYSCGNWYWCGNCHHEWEAEVEELGNAIASSEVMEVAPAQKACPIDLIAPDEDFSQGCPECGSWDIEITPISWNNSYLVQCTNCIKHWWFANKLPTALIPKEEPVKSEVIELLPTPREIIADQMPEWEQRHFIPETLDRASYDDNDDFDYDDEYSTYNEADNYVHANYRGWKLLFWEQEHIYAIEPNGEIHWWCECERNMESRDGQIAIAQEFIDSWYFAQPSPGQLSLNIIETVAHDPPTRPLLQLIV
jgi:transcription elongation factor Elf1